MKSNQTNDMKVHKVNEPKSTPAQILATDGPRRVTAPPNESAAKEARTILSRGGRPFSERQVKRVLRVFQDLGILGKYETRIIKGRAVSGWQMAQHAHWAEASGGLCDFTYWREYEPNQRTYQNNQRVVIDNGTATVTHNGTDSEDNGTVNGTDASAVMPLKIQILRELQTEKCS